MSLCQKCKSKLNENGYCSNCNMSEETYNRIISMSNLLYNKGLAMAKVRDLSGAIDVLKQSLKLNKLNTQARNLLGLVYFEVGETVLAINQWVISENLDNNKNIAGEYIGLIHNNQNYLAKINKSINKYNQSLKYIESNSADLAKIQLKKITTTNPNFVKAYCLLALIYIKDEEYDHAKKELAKVLEIDKTNLLAQKYYMELGDKGDEKTVLSTDERIVKEGRRMERQIAINQKVQQFLGVVFGLVVGAGLVYFLVNPNIVSTLKNDISSRETQLIEAEKTGKQFEEQAKIDSEKIAALEQEITQANEKLDQFSLDNEKMNDVLASFNALLDEDYIKSANLISAVNPNELSNTQLVTVVGRIRTITFPKIVDPSYKYGLKLYSNGKYEEGITHLANAYKFMTTEAYKDDIVYYLGRCYQLTGDSEKAIRFFKEVIDKYPDSDKRTYSKNMLAQLGAQ